MVYDEHGNAGWQVHLIVDRRKSKSKGYDYLCKWLPLGEYDDDWTHEDNMGKGLAGMIDDFNKSFDSTKVLPEVMCEKCLGTSLTFLDLLIFPRIIHKTLEVNRKLPEILIDTSKINQTQTIQHRRGRRYSTFP